MKYLKELQDIMESLRLEKLEQLVNDPNIWIAKYFNKENGRISQVRPDVKIIGLESIIDEIGIEDTKVFLNGYIKAMDHYLFSNFSDVDKDRLTFERAYYLFKNLDRIGDNVILKGVLVDKTLMCPGYLNRISDIYMVSFSDAIKKIIYKYLKIYPDNITLNFDYLPDSLHYFDDGEYHSSAICGCEVPSSISYNANKSVLKTLNPNLSFSEVLGFYYINEIVYKALKATDDKVFSKDVLNNFIVKTKVYKLLDEQLPDLFKDTLIDKKSTIYNRGLFPIKMDVLDGVDKDMTASEYAKFIHKNWLKL